MEEKDEDKLFDSQIRSVLGDAREDVPGQVWLGIEQRLSAMEAGPAESAVTRHRKAAVIPLWMKVAASTAAAAAVAALLFLSGSFDGTVQDRQYSRMAESNHDFGIIATGENGLHNIMTADIPHPADITGIPYPDTTEAVTDGLAHASGGSETAVPDVAEASGSTETEEVPVQGNEAVNTDAEPANGRNDAGTGDAGSADTEEAGDAAEWARLLGEDDGDRSGIRTAITLSGNAISNTNPTVSYDGAPISYSSGRPRLTEDRVIESDESSYSVPVSVGVGVKVDFAKRWAASIGVNYSRLNRTFGGTFFDLHDDGTYTTTDFSHISNSQDYIGIPVNVYYNILKSRIIEFYAYAGGAAEKCVSNAFRMSADGTDINHREAVKGMQFSANVGLGMEFVIADLVGIYIDPSLRYYFPDERQPRSIRTAQPLMFGVELGFRFHL